MPYLCGSNHNSFTEQSRSSTVSPFLSSKKSGLGCSSIREIFIDHLNSSSFKTFLDVLGLTPRFLFSWAPIKFLLSVIFLITVGFFNAMASEYAGWRNPRVILLDTLSGEATAKQSLPDIGHDIISFVLGFLTNGHHTFVDWWELPDYSVEYMNKAVIALIILHPLKLRVFKRYAVIFGLINVIRAFTVLMTTLPDPSPLCRAQFTNDQGFYKSQSFFPLGIERSVHRIMYGSSREFPTCGDMIFSGHTTLIVLGCLCFREYCRPTFAWCRIRIVAALLKSIRVFFYFACPVASLAIIGTHFHYTVDVAIAVVLAFFSWWGYHMATRYWKIISNSCHTPFFIKSIIHFFDSDHIQELDQCALAAYDVAWNRIFDALKSKQNSNVGIRSLCMNFLSSLIADAGVLKPTSSIYETIGDFEVASNASIEPSNDATNKSRKYEMEDFVGNGEISTTTDLSITTTTSSSGCSNSPFSTNVNRLRHTVSNQNQSDFNCSSSNSSYQNGFNIQLNVDAPKCSNNGGYCISSSFSMWLLRKMTGCSIDNCNVENVSGGNLNSKTQSINRHLYNNSNNHSIESGSDSDSKGFKDSIFHNSKYTSKNLATKTGDNEQFSSSGGISSPRQHVHNLISIVDNNNNNLIINNQNAINKSAYHDNNSETSNENNRNILLLNDIRNVDKHNPLVL